MSGSFGWYAHIQIGRRIRDFSQFVQVDRARNEQTQHCIGCEWNVWSFRAVRSHSIWTKAFRFQPIRASRPRTKRPDSTLHRMRMKCPVVSGGTLTFELDESQGSTISTKKNNTKQTPNHYNHGAVITATA